MPDIRLLEVKRVSKQFPGVQALDRVDFTLDAGSVHAVCGENGAGKSTLMNILMGLYRKDGGEILLKGQPVDFSLPRQALNAGISIIAQELNPVPDMTVAENIFLGREATHLGIFVDYSTLHRQAEKVIGELGLRINVRRKMKTLSLAEVQMVEIAKALSHDSDILIMDEPTSALGEHDAESLFRVIRVLRDRGKGIVYVSHRLKEIFTIADAVTVLRDGKYIGTKPIREITRTELISMMIGRKMEEEFVKENSPTAEIVLQVSGLTKRSMFRGIDLEVRHAEILGIFGLMGSGRSEFFSALFGSIRPDSGRISIDGEAVSFSSPRQAIKSGIALITEDRKASGLVLSSSVRDNISLPSLRGFTRPVLIDERKEERRVREIVERFSIKTPSLRQMVKYLSGGNQQKVVLSKWLLTEPRILLLDEPTRGIDVGSKREIYRFMSDFARKGFAVVMISSELPEILGMSDRIAVFRNGEVSALFSRGEATQEKLMHAASWGRKGGERAGAEGGAA